MAQPNNELLLIRNLGQKDDCRSVINLHLQLLRWCMQTIIDRQLGPAPQSDFEFWEKDVIKKFDLTETKQKNYHRRA